MADLVSDLVWAPMGAEHDAEIICDALGTAVHDGGLAATARDLLRFGQMLLDGGAVPGRRRGSRSVVPPRWLRRAWAVDAEGRSLFLASPAEVSFPGGWYRNQFWFRPGEHGDVLLCLGIHGQMVHVSRRTGTVCVKLSSWPDPPTRRTSRTRCAPSTPSAVRWWTGPPRADAPACPESSPGCGAAGRRDAGRRGPGSALA